MRRLIESTHLDLCYLQKPIIIACDSERVNKLVIRNGKLHDSQKSRPINCKVNFRCVPYNRLVYPSVRGHLGKMRIFLELLGILIVCTQNNTGKI